MNESLEFVLMVVACVLATVLVIVGLGAALVLLSPEVVV